MSGKKRLGVVAAIFLALMLMVMPVLAACGSDGSEGSGGSGGDDGQGGNGGEVKTLQIGAAMTLTGPGAMVGMVINQGLELAFEHVNDLGGLQINGDTYMIEYLVEDDEGTPDGAATALTKLIYQDGIDIVLHQLNNDFAQSYEVTGEAGAFLAITYSAFSSAISPGTEVGPDTDLAIRLQPSDDETCRVPIEYLVEAYPDVETVSIMNLDLPGFEIQVPHTEAALAEYGLEVGGECVTYATDCLDFQPVVTRVLQQEPDGVYVLHALLDQFIMITKTLREQGFDGPIFFSSPFDGSLVARAIPDVSDVFGAGIALETTNLPDSVQEVVDMGKAAYGDDFAGDSIGAYDAGMLLAQLIEVAQSTDPAELMATFESLTTPGSLQSIYGDACSGGLVTLGANRTIVRPVPLCRLVDGEGDYIGSFPIEIP